MRKDKVWKQVLALVLSAALVVGNGTSVSAATGDPAADNGAGTAAEGTAGSTRKVSDTDAYKELTFDFEDGQMNVSGDDGIYTENGITFVNRNGVELAEAPVVTEDDAQSHGKALKFTHTKEMTLEDGSKVTTGDSCLTSVSEAFSELDFTNGFTLSMEIYPEAQRDWNYMFGLGVFGEKWVSGSIGFIAQYGEPWSFCFPRDGWLEGNTVNSNYNYFIEEANVHKWYKLDYVYTLDGFSVKVNGVPAVAWGVDRAKMQAILEEASNGQLRLGMGSATENEGFLGYIDNVSIQPKAPCEHALGDNLIASEEPTCTTNGLKKGTCTKCNEIITLTIPAVGHDFGEPVAAKEATCTEKGNIEYYTCTREANSYFVSGDDGVKQVAKSKVEIAAKGHNYGAATVTTKATPDKDGVITSVCSACPEGTDGHTKTEVINKVNNITLAGTSFAHTGNDIKPAVTVKDSKGTVIAASNYTVSYSNNKNPGTATVTITFKGDKYAGSVRKTFTIGAAASLKLDKTKATLYTGNASKTVTIKTTVTGASTTVTWVSSNPKVATVKNGKITAVKAGKATITATANGISQKVTVTVKNPTITIKNGKKAVKKNTVTVKRKKSVKLTVTVSPKNSGIKVAKLTKKQAKIATVTYKKGKLTIKGKKKGTVKVKITSGKGTKTLTVKVK